MKHRRLDPSVLTAPRSFAVPAHWAPGRCVVSHPQCRLLKLVALQPRSKRLADGGHQRAAL